MTSSVFSNVPAAPNHQKAFMSLIHPPKSLPIIPNPNRGAFFLHLSRTDVSESLSNLITLESTPSNQFTERGQIKGILKRKGGTPQARVCETGTDGEKIGQAISKSIDFTTAVRNLKESKISPSELADANPANFVRQRKVKRVTFSVDTKDPEYSPTKTLVARFKWSTPKETANQENQPKQVNEVKLNIERQEERKRGKSKTLPPWMPMVGPASEILNQIRRNREIKLQNNSPPSGAKGYNSIVQTWRNQNPDEQKIQIKNVEQASEAAVNLKASNIFTTDLKSRLPVILPRLTQSRNGSKQDLFNDIPSAESRDADDSFEAIVLTDTSNKSKQAIISSLNSFDTTERGLKMKIPKMLETFSRKHKL